MTYVQSHFCNSMIDPDIYLLQVSQLDNADIVLYKYGISLERWLSDDTERSVLLKEFIT